MLESYNSDETEISGLGEAVESMAVYLAEPGLFIIGKESKINGQIQELINQIIKEAKSGYFQIALLKLNELENLGVESRTIEKIIEEMFETKPKLKGLSFIQIVQEFIGTELQDGLLHPETLLALQDLAVESEIALFKGYLARSNEISAVIDFFNVNFNKLKEYSYETKKFQEFIGMPENEQTGKMNQKTLVTAAMLYAKIERTLKAAPGNKMARINLEIIKGYLFGLEIRINSNSIIQERKSA
jgi:hypothetical protein